MQSELTAQITQDPAFMPYSSQAGPLRLPMQSVLLMHGWQVWLPVSHRGSMPLQSELASHATQVPEG